jgi:predicted transcriptional regulator
MRVETVMKPLDSTIQSNRLPQVPLGTDLKRVLSLMLSPASNTVLVCQEGNPIGYITFEELRKVGCLSA